MNMKIGDRYKTKVTGVFRSCNFTTAPTFLALMGLLIFSVVARADFVTFFDNGRGLTISTSSDRAREALNHLEGYRIFGIAPGPLNTGYPYTDEDHTKFSQSFTDLLAIFMSTISQDSHYDSQTEFFTSVYEDSGILCGTDPMVRCAKPDPGVIYKMGEVGYRDGSIDTFRYTYAPTPEPASVILLVTVSAAFVFVLKKTHRGASYK